MLWHIQRHLGSDTTRVNRVGKETLVERDSLLDFKLAWDLRKVDS